VSGCWDRERERERERESFISNLFRLFVEAVLKGWREEEEKKEEDSLSEG
jgi:hypothetical protein